MKNIIAASFSDRARVYRMVYNGVNESESLVYNNIPCALARSAHNHSPTPVGYDTQTPTKNYRLRLYAAPEVTFLLGDRVEVYRGGRVFIGLASDSFYYDSHSVCVMEIGEVRENDND
ncbi:MAG: hypothetical protein IKU13_01645 [Clostridia bacterium]|nr:hypothetical protein [Clostridia bacterium]